MIDDYTFKIVANDGCKVPVELRKDGATFTISDSAAVKAAIVSRDHSKAWSAVVSQQSTENGADWANSLLVVAMSADDLVQLQAIDKQERIEIEIEVTEPGQSPITWHHKNGVADIGHV